MLDPQEQFGRRIGTRTGHRPAYRGFTLIELVVVIIILGVLAAVAVPKYISLATGARVASLQTLSAAINSTAINVRTLCKTNPACDYGANYQNVLIGNRSADLNYGWLDAGNTLGAAQIDAWIDYNGFTASLPSDVYTLFTLDGAPDLPNCSVRYGDVYFLGPAATPSVTITTTGC